MGNVYQISKCMQTNPQTSWVDPVDYWLLYNGFYILAQKLFVQKYLIVDN